VGALVSSRVGTRRGGLATDAAGEVVGVGALVARHESSAAARREGLAAAKVLGLDFVKWTFGVLS